MHLEMRRFATIIHIVREERQYLQKACDELDQDAGGRRSGHS
jgi:hypothetical protein